MDHRVFAETRAGVDMGELGPFTGRESVSISCVRPGGGAQLAAGVTVAVITPRQVKNLRPRYGLRPPNYPTSW
jgi:hypothetical protein